MEQVIRLDHVSKTYHSRKQDVQAVKDVSLQFEAGKSYAVTGPSGCGKSTLINMIGLLLRPTEGTVYIGEKDTAALSTGEKAEQRNKTFGYIAQDYLLVNDETVSKNIEIPLYYRKEKLPGTKKEMISEVLKQVGLLDKMNVRCSELSGGQMQRAAIARALINDPEVILADEPTGALDSETGKEVFDLLLSLVKKGKTLIMVTHNPELAEACDEEIRMLDGRIV